MPAPKELDPSASVAALLGAKIRKLRSRAGLTQKELGQKVYVTHTRIAQTELGTDPPNRSLTESLDIALGADGDVLDIWGLLDFSPHPQWVRRFMTLEVRAVEICKFTAIIPGLLQTEEYARAVLRTGLPPSDEVLEERVSARIDRQELLRAVEPPVVWAILDEVALRRPVGGPDVMREQLQSLLAAMKHPRVIVQVLPFNQGEHSAMSGAITVLTMPGGDRVAYLEGHNSGELVEDSHRVAEIALRYDLLRAQALPPDKSEAMIRKVMEDSYPCTPRDPD